MVSTEINLEVTSSVGAQQNETLIGGMKSK